MDALPIVKIAKTQDFVLEPRILVADEIVECAGSVGVDAESIPILPDHPTLLTGDKILFGDNIIVTLDDNCLAGSTVLPIDALVGMINTGQKGHKIRDLTGYTIEVEILNRRGDATPLISYTGASITLLTQTGVDRGKFQVQGLAADTENLTPRTYYGTAWKRDSGTRRPILEFSVILYEAGFL